MDDHNWIVGGPIFNPVCAYIVIIDLSMQRELCWDMKNKLTYTSWAAPLSFAMLKLLLHGLGTDQAGVLQQGLDWACGPGKAKCDPIQPGGDCYLPNTVISHASYAFNIHYHWFQSDPRSCVFGGDATLTNVDPSKSAHLSFASHPAMRCSRQPISTLCNALNEGK